MVRNLAHVLIERYRITCPAAGGCHSVTVSALVAEALDVADGDDAAFDADGGFVEQLLEDAGNSFAL